MAQNAYSAYYAAQPQHDPRVQPYPYSSYPQQQQQPPQLQQTYGQPGQFQSPIRYPTQDPSRFAAPGDASRSRSPLPSPLHSPAAPVAYGHQPYSQYPRQASYPPSAYDPRSVYMVPGQTSPAPAHTPARRPLPQPVPRSQRADTLPPSTSGLQEHPPSPSPRASTHRPALSVSAIQTGTPRSDSPHASPPKTTTSVSPPRPLPLPQPQTHAIPRSFGYSNLARSPSPTKNGITEPQPGPGQKFVPHWKRALPAPGQPSTSTTEAQPIERRSTVSGSEPPSVLQRQSGGIRPLPQSPVVSVFNQHRSPSTHPLPPIPGILQRQPSQQSKSPPRMLPQPQSQVQPNITSTLRSASPATIGSSVDSSDGEDLSAHVLLSRPREQGGRLGDQEQVHSSRQGRESPQYGILDMPSRVRPATDETHDVGARGKVQSATMRFATMSLQQEQESQSPPPATTNGQSSSRPPSRTHGYSQSVPNANAVVRPHPMPPMARTLAQPGTTRWPTGLPPLPKVPGSGEGGIVSEVRKQSIFGRMTPLSSQRPSVLDLNLDDAPPPSLRRSPSPMRPNSHVVTGDRTTSDLINRSPSRKPSPPASIRTYALDRPELSTNGVPSGFSRSGNLPSPMSATSPSSAASASSAFTLSAFPRPPSSAAPGPPSHPFPSPKHSGVDMASVTSPSSAISPTSANSTGSSVFTLSSFPQPPSSPANSGGASIGRAGDVEGTRHVIPKISFPANADDDEDSEEDLGPVISVSGPDDDQTAIPSISVGVEDDDNSSTLPQLSLNGGTKKPVNRRSPLERLIRKGTGLTCGGCGGAIVGRTVSAMGARWHPGCFRCCVCDELLEHLSSYEHEGRAYCHLDYHERFAPKCYHCKTAIVDERFITLDDPELGKRTYHELHFFCAECGDPFLAPSSSSRGPSGEQTFSGDGSFVSGEDDVGFTVYRGHPYCEACHVRLRLPKCKRCKKPIRDGKRAVEALGGKWCWECFVCASCERPFENPSFFQRDGKPFCEHCFSIMIKNEM